MLDAAFTFDSPVKFGQPWRLIRWLHPISTMIITSPVDSKQIIDLFAMH